MKTPPPQESRLFNFASGVFGLLLVFCGFEMVPGWGILHVKWPVEVFYVIMMISGAFAGVARDPRYLPGGIVGGAGAGFGALFALGLVLTRVTVMNKVVLLLVAAIGCLPGIGLYVLFRYAQDALFKEES